MGGGNPGVTLEEINSGADSNSDYGAFQTNWIGKLTSPLHPMLPKGILGAAARTNLMVATG
jgi:hypothetical protein